MSRCRPCPRWTLRYRRLLRSRFPLSAQAHIHPIRQSLPGIHHNLLVAGRCISATHEALASTRVIAPSMAQGEAAGIAGAMAARTRTLLRALDVAAVRDALSARGAFLGE